MDKTRLKIILLDDNMASLTQGKNILKPYYQVGSIPVPG